eukprot:8179489-Prorocentrum_lima.AAC.1
MAGDWDGYSRTDSRRVEDEPNAYDRLRYVKSLRTNASSHAHRARCPSRERDAEGRRHPQVGGGSDPSQGDRVPIHNMRDPTGHRDSSVRHP